MGRRKMTPEELAELRKNPPETGTGGKRNFPNARPKMDTPENKAIVSRILNEVLVEYRKPKVKSDDEMAERLNDYFNRCAERGQIPTVEEMELSTGYTDRDLWEIETGVRKGFSPATSYIIKKAKSILKSFDAKMVIDGKLNFLAYCFRAKNYYGMVDKQEYVLTPNTKQEDEFSAEDIKARYMIEGD